ncbi:MULTISPECIES: riboflavin synthase [unclassified Sphingomonas]|uniref:riboflavin synthase n=1 Tax=unclassified Sphingomonas TaxID=196159 RepID=UPI000700F6BF|nr:MULTISPECIES: riboflavin synthase [unclassified Sphingomonas]KQM62183.1 riboflavin synthase subunit alpha [Sphingomonas sp. Leaf16]KQN13587.1 riboflavin synthase subunit alpha [Sphingomonas sp. Leaf29]KQN23180.1 riboflavin synthase subunit alpha [Sphingomonas sp. Leaf32]
MFTGIVSDVGRIESIDGPGDLRVRIGCAYDTTTIDMGASIACSGVCLTVVDKSAPGEPGWFAVDVSGETVSRTADQWVAGRQLNLERALKLGDELGGHIVTGHVDGVGHVVERHADKDSTRVTFAIPRTLSAFVAPKGSVTIDGVSLTVNDVADMAEGTRFTVNLIPHTQAVTTLGHLAEGQSVNIEIDVLARYLMRMEQVRGQS